MAQGIDTRHKKGCENRRKDGRCCGATFQAHVFNRRTGKRIRKTFNSISGARRWRRDALSALEKGTMTAPSSLTLRAACEQWLKDARAGLIRNRSGDLYKAAAIRGYEQALRLRVWDDLGPRRITDIRRVDLQDLVDRLVADELSPSTVQCAITALRPVYRRLINRGELELNPTVGLALPAVRSGSKRIVPPAEAAGLLAPLNAHDRAIWATAMFAGLRRGELMGLRWEDIDLDGGTLRVERGWDLVDGEAVAPKSRQGKRTVPLPKALRAYIAAHRLACSWRDGLAFGATSDQPFDPRQLSLRADAAWKKLGRITLHEGRHTYASLMIAAGVNAKTLEVFMGHANIAITLDLYGHLMPGSEGEAAGLMDAYLDAAQAV